MSWENLLNHKQIKFIDLWLFLSKEIGNSRLPLNPEARQIHDLVYCYDEHMEFIKQIILQTYKQNHCQQLSSPIKIETVLDSLGEMAFHLRNNQKDDLLHIELLEEIAWYIIQRYGHLLPLNSISIEEQPKGQVISFKNYKIRCANSKY